MVVFAGWVLDQYLRCFPNNPSPSPDFLSLNCYSVLAPKQTHQIFFMVCALIDQVHRQVLNILWRNFYGQKECRPWKNLVDFFLIITRKNIYMRNLLYFPLRNCQNQKRERCVANRFIFMVILSSTIALKQSARQNSDTKFRALHTRGKAVTD